jgi:hypothetical protein
MPGNRDQQSRRGGRNDAAAVRPSSRAGKGNRAAKTRTRGRRRSVDESGFGRQGGASQGRGVGTLGLELEGGQSREGVGTLNLPLEGGVGSLGLELEGRDSAPRRGVGSLDLDLEGEEEGTGSLGLDLE